MFRETVYVAGRVGSIARECSKSQAFHDTLQMAAFSGHSGSLALLSRSLTCCQPTLR